MIVGGCFYDSLQKTDLIYFAMSKDISDDSINNIWQMAKIALPFTLCKCKCMITHQSTNNPKLIILGGQKNKSLEDSNIFLEYKLSDIMGYHTFQRFILDFTKVIMSQNTNLFCVWVCVCVFVCV